MKLLTPTDYVGSIYDIDLNNLKKIGIKVVVLDIDNTLVPTSTKSPTEQVSSWIKNAQSKGFEVVLASNNSQNRVQTFNKDLNLFAIHRAAKPLKYGFKKIREKYGVSNREICMVGDQLFTDILGANLSGIMSILVMPLTKDEGAGIKFKRLIENIAVRKYKKETYCLIGNPVLHSKSAVLHNTVYNFYNMPARYLLCHTEKENLKQTVEKFINTGVKGFNITVPFKTDIIPHLDWISEDAKKIGSVNTVKIINKKCNGYNTDGDGFIMQLKSDGTTVKDSRIKIVGAGGSTMSIVYALVKEGAKNIIIYNRTIEKAKQIAENYSNVAALPLDEFSAMDCEILINTTSVGLFPDVDSSPVESLDGISKNTAVYDIIYSPPETKFMKMARKAGCKAYNGSKLLIYQGLIADEIWFERSIINKVLVEKISNKLIGGNENE